MDKVIILDKILPKQINKDIIKFLGKTSWEIGSEYDTDILKDKYENGYKGFLCKTFHHTRNPQSTHDILNVYADIIFKKVLEELGIKGKPLRYYWNMYYKDHNTTVHRDVHEKGFKTILYTLENTDGGVWINQKFYKDVMSQAKIFDSRCLHKGQGPTNDPIRFNLNIVFKEEDDII